MNIDAPELSERARTAVLDPGNTLYLSAASGWEIAVKHQLGRLNLPAAPAAYVPSRREFLGVRSLPISEDDSLHVSKLPALHRDPFDRMLVCQAILRGMAIVTPDAAIAAYPVKTLW